VFPTATTLRDGLPAAGLDETLRAEILQAARIADFEGLMKLLARIPHEHESVAAALRSLLEAYAYPEIEALLKGA
jgi:hypothetical protein